MSQNKPLVSIITINFRDAATTSALLDSITKQSYSNIQVIVVDNGSLEEVSETFKAHYSEVEVIVSKENRGFAGGNNLGIQAAKGDYLFFVNNDTVFTPDLIEQSLAAFTTDEIGVVAPKIYYFDQPEIIQYAGFTPINPLTARNQTIGKDEKEEGQHDVSNETPYAHGAAMMLRRSVVEQVGAMPEDYFLYYEEMDWCVQIRNAGYKIIYAPKAMIYHKESIAVGKMSPLKTYYLTRNRILFMRRNASRLSWILFILFFSFVTFPRWVLQYTLKREWGHLRAFIRAVAWHVQRNRKAKSF